MMAGTESERALSTTGAQAVATRVKPYNEWLRGEFIAYKAETGYSHKQLAAELGLRSETAVTKYLSGKPEGDVAKLEALIDDVMRSRFKRRESRAQLIATNVTNAMEAAFETIRETNLIGVVKGPSGIGKSAGGSLYVVKNPTSILIAASALQRRGSDIIGLLWDELRPRTWSPSKGTRLSEIFRKLSGASRLIIVDDAHRLSPRGLDMVVAIHNRTQSPIAMVGYDEKIEQAMIKDAQNYSRLGPVWDLKLEDGEELARHLLGQFVPDSGELLLDLAMQVIAHDGHARALLQEILLARKMKELLEDTKKRVDWPTAFLMAHTKLIRPYELSVN